MRQHRISVMLAEQLKLSFLAPKKLCGLRIVNRSETRTTLILDRYGQAERITTQTEKILKIKIMFLSLETL